MESERIDHLARSLVASGSRRGLTRLLGGLVLGGVLGPRLSIPEAAAGKGKRGKKKCNWMAGEARCKKNCCRTLLYETCCNGTCCDEAEQCCGKQCCPRGVTCSTDGYCA